MKRYISILLFAFLIMISSCKRKCAFCELSSPNPNKEGTEVCRKDFGNKVEWEAEIKFYESVGRVCTIHR